MRNRVFFCWLTLAMGAVALGQEPSLGDVARASRARQARLPKATQVFSNDDSAPQAIQDGDDPLAVFSRARDGFLHDTSHRCQQESSGNSGPGWKKSATYEVAAADRMRLVSQDGQNGGEFIFAGGAYYRRQDGASWQKLSDPQQVRLGQMTFPAALIPQELQFAFQPGELKYRGDEQVEGIPTVLYQFTAHNFEMDRTVDLWIGKQDGLPRRIDMRTETRYQGISPVIWSESTTCHYGVEIKIEPPL